MATKTETRITSAIRTILTILEEVRDCGQEMDLTKTAVEVYFKATDNEICSVCGAHKRNYLDEMHRTCREEFHPDKEG